jgi:hypothetical protein
MSNHGSFSGNPKTEWLTESDGSDRNMSLLEDFWYDDPNGKRWLASYESVINGASIPRPLWSTVGSPFTDDYRRASIVHDVACNDRNVKREDADKMFYEACLAGGCSYLQAKLLYAGVRIGTWASATFPSKSFAKERLLFRVPFVAGADEQFLKSKFHEVAAGLKLLPDDAPIAEIDEVIAKHIKF